MSQTVEMHIIARIRSDFPTKFGIPRQSGLADVPARIVFEPEYRNTDALRGIEGFSHLWLIWQFSAAVREGWSPTVRPPKLGGNKRIGRVCDHARRSGRTEIGLSSVRLDRVELNTPDGPVLHISGADLMDGTPIFDIKPYLAYTDSHPEARGGFALTTDAVRVECPATLLGKLPEERRQTLLNVLAQDPRPGYQHEPGRVYGFPFAGFEVKFTVEGDLLTVRQIESR